MPELPEVETVRRILESELKGRRILRVTPGRPTFYRKPDPETLSRVTGKKLSAVRRRGKYLMLETEDNGILTLHLGMSGRLFLSRIGEVHPSRDKHCRLLIEFEGALLKFIDPRRFGRAGCALPEIGPEPLSGEFDPAYLQKALRGRKASVKAMLLDQSVVAGLGNIYATEALYAAGLRPGRAAGRIKKSEIEILHRTIREVLGQGIALGGSTLSDKAFLDPLGRPGRAQTRLSIYGRERGRCGHLLRKTKKPISGRTSLFCPECQK